MGVPDPILPVSTERPRKHWGRYLAVGCATLVSLPLVWKCHHLTGDLHFAPVEAAGCDQAEPLQPFFNSTALIAGEKDRIISWLSGAIKVPTEIFDVMGAIGEDERWNTFTDFATYLQDSFPLTHQSLTVTYVHTFGLVYEWEGTDASLKPLLLTSHQDVVPVLSDTRPQWSHDPYGGEFDGEKIWGRGATDDKSGLIGSLAAVELLLEWGEFTPQRTVILGLGYDEEASGKGAGYINDWLLDKYGEDSISLLVDEGNGFSEVYGQMFAVPAVAEKGYLDAEVRVETKGGHSSVPPPHTGIGLMSLAVAALEQNPYPLELGAESPMVDFVACAARYAPNTPAKLKKDIAKVVKSRSKGRVDRKALHDVQKWWASDDSTGAGFYPPGMGAALISTTQAVDMIAGGVKVNALPEVVTAVVNHRISIESSVKHVQDRMTRTLAPLAKEHNLALEAWGETVVDHEEAAGKLVLSVAWNATIETAPVSPFTTDSGAWRVLAGTTKGTWATRPGATGDEIHMAPLMSTGNTDTKNYWRLTRNIYRFAYLPAEGMEGIHTVDESVNANAFVEQVRWFINLIVNADHSRDI